MKSDNYGKNGRYASSRTHPSKPHAPKQATTPQAAARTNATSPPSNRMQVKAKFVSKPGCLSHERYYE